ncbi:MAG TPA: VIT family protein [Propionicimonas sp.]|nr:VIT family protein [Propionicimonas sp.]HRA05345.1 VIT family protein [Propionicimonas sp.]
MAITVRASAANRQSLSARLNWLRAGVLGANDGIVSTAGLVFGVAGATTDSLALLIAGLAGLVAGSLSMAGGEYVSVSSQKDTETAALDDQTRRLSKDPAGELQRLADHYAASGLSPLLARQVAEELTTHAPLDAHAQVFLGLDANERVSPWAAARASMLSFSIGAAIPLVAIVTTPTAVRLPLTVVAVLAALTLTGVVSARLGGARPWRAVARNVVVGTLAMGLTYFVGWLVSLVL